MSGYTPGPWEVREHKFDGLCVHAPAIEKVSGCDYRVVENVNGDETPEPTYGTPEANARLIAAAPDLLEALQETDIDLTVLMSNIADAMTRDPKWDGMREIVSKWRERNRSAIAKATGEQP